MVKKKEKEMEDMPHIETTPEKKYIDVNDTSSEYTGLMGAFEKILRSYKGLAFVFAIIPGLLAYIIALGVSLTPAYIILTTVYSYVSELNILARALIMCTTFAFSYGTYMFSLILVVPLLNWMMPIKIKPWKGNWYSVQTIPWYYHNALVQLVRYTVLDFITPTPLNVLFYKLMGMKVGKNCVINTSNISDPCLIELEDNVTIGGSATIFGHYAQAGILVLAPVKIKRGATIGLKASIMGDVIVGEKVTVKPHSILLPKTRLNKGDPQ